MYRVNKLLVNFGELQNHELQFKQQRLEQISALQISSEECNSDGNNLFLDEAFISAENLDIEQGAEQQEDRIEQNLVQLPEVVLDIIQNCNAAVHFDNSNLSDLHFEHPEEITKNLALAQVEFIIPENKALEIPNLLEKIEGFINKIEKEMAQGPKIKLP